LTKKEQPIFVAEGGIGSSMKLLLFHKIQGRAVCANPGSTRTLQELRVDFRYEEA